jgi:hypothetical protein
MLPWANWHSATPAARGGERRPCASDPGCARPDASSAPTGPCKQLDRGQTRRGEARARCRPGNERVNAPAARAARTAPAARAASGRAPCSCCREMSVDAAALALFSGLLWPRARRQAPSARKLTLPVQSPPPPVTGSTSTPARPPQAASQRRHVRLHGRPASRPPPVAAGRCTSVGVPIGRTPAHRPRR